MILTTDGTSVPEPAYTAEVVAEDHALDLAVLRITGDEVGVALSSTDALPFVPLGDCSPAMMALNPASAPRLAARNGICTRRLAMPRLRSRATVAGGGTSGACILPIACSALP